MDADIKREFERLHEKINVLMSEAKAHTWVKVSIVKSLTIFNTKERLRVAREGGILKMRKGRNGIEYDLTSIPDKFFTHERTNTTHKPTIDFRMPSNHVAG